jgi:uncharacterized protein YndB with AHSA1/START domain
MTTNLSLHNSFNIERIYKATPERAFAAWSDPAIKARWFIGPGTWTPVRRELDFTVGGIEVLHGKFADGSETYFEARYHEIIPNERIVYVYDMHVKGKLHSVSLATVEFSAVGSGTRMLFTEQVAFLDGTDAIAGGMSRQHGTAAHFDRIPDFI